MKLSKVFTSFGTFNRSRRIGVGKCFVVIFCNLAFCFNLGFSNESGYGNTISSGPLGGSSMSPNYHEMSFNARSPLIKSMPQILSHDQILRAKQGHSIVLPCQVVNLDSFVVMWKQASRVLTAGNLVVRKDPRMSLRDDYSLELSDITPDDQGVYTCEIDIMGKPISIKHTIEVLVPPAIQAMPRVGKVTVRKGKDFTLRCAAKGNPNPTISWSKESGLLPSGHGTEEGLSLELRQVQRDDGGTYVCTANNGVGQPAKANIEVEIKYPPEIEIEQTWYQPNGEKSVEVELLCTVHANPEAEISWYRLQKKLHENDRQLFQSKPGSLRLSIRNVKNEDFGNYSCKAENTLGKARAYISISGRPRPPRFTSEAIGHKPHTYNVTWTTDSISPVTEYKLFYRQSDGLPFAQTENIHELSGTWEKVFIPVLEPANVFTTKETYTLKHIQPGAVYEILAIAKNQHGWSEYSKIFNFFNKGVDYSTQQLSAIAEQQFNSGEIDGLSLDKGQSSNLRSDVTGDHHSRKYSTSLTDISSYATARCRAQSSLFLSLLFVSISHQILLSQSNRW